MSKIVNIAWLAIPVLLAASCSSLQSPYTYNEVVILNQTRSAVRDVAVSATESGRMFSCDNIAPHGICSTRFPPQPYRASPLRIDWAIGNGTRHSKIVELTLPSNLVAGLPLRGVLVIDLQGEISAYLQQEVAGPYP